MCVSSPADLCVCLSLSAAFASLLAAVLSPCLQSNIQQHAGADDPAAAAAALAKTAAGEAATEGVAEGAEEAAPKKRVGWSGWTVSGLRYVAMSPVKLRGTSCLRKRDTAVVVPADPRVKPFPHLRTSKAERLAAVVLLLLIALCAFVAVAEDLVDVVCLLAALVRQLWFLSVASATHLSEWLAVPALKLAGRLTD